MNQAEEESEEDIQKSIYEQKKLKTNVYTESPFLMKRKLAF